MDAIPYGTAAYKELLKMSWRSLIIRAIADSHEFFSQRFLREAEKRSPFRFEFLRSRTDRLASRQGLYKRLFEGLTGSRAELGSLPRPEGLRNAQMIAGYALCDQPSDGVRALTRCVS